MKKILYLILIFCTAAFMDAQQFVYKPVNPAFGGDTFNYQWLQSSATVQNQFDNATGNRGLSSLGSLNSFTENLNRQLLNEITRKLMGEKFGDGDLKPGTYIFGSMYLEVIQTGQGLLLNILNTSTGEQSEILLPGN